MVAGIVFKIKIGNCY